MADGGVVLTHVLVARAARAGALGAATLGHEAGDDPVEGHAIVVPRLDEVEEPIGAQGGPLPVNLVALEQPGGYGTTSPLPRYAILMPGPQTKLMTYILALVLETSPTRATTATVVAIDARTFSTEQTVVPGRFSGIATPITLQ